MKREKSAAELHFVSQREMLWPPYLDSGRSQSSIRQPLEATVCSQGSQDCDDQRIKRRRDERDDNTVYDRSKCQARLSRSHLTSHLACEASDNHRDQVETYGRDTSDVNSLKRISLTHFYEPLVDNWMSDAQYCSFQMTNEPCFIKIASTEKFFANDVLL